MLERYICGKNVLSSGFTDWQQGLPPTSPAQSSWPTDWILAHHSGHLWYSIFCPSCSQSSTLRCRRSSSPNSKPNCRRHFLWHMLRRWSRWTSAISTTNSGISWLLHPLVFQCTRSRSTSIGWPRGSTKSVRNIGGYLPNESSVCSMASFLLYLLTLVSVQL